MTLAPTSIPSTPYYSSSWSNGVSFDLTNINDINALTDCTSAFNTWLQSLTGPCVALLQPNQVYGASNTISFTTGATNITLNMNGSTLQTINTTLYSQLSPSNGSQIGIINGTISGGLNTNWEGTQFGNSGLDMGADGSVTGCAIRINGTADVFINNMTFLNTAATAIRATQGGTVNSYPVPPYNLMSTRVTVTNCTGINIGWQAYDPMATQTFRTNNNSWTYVYEWLVDMEQDDCGFYGTDLYFQNETVGVTKLGLLSINPLSTAPEVGNITFDHVTMQQAPLADWSTYSFFDVSNPGWEYPSNGGSVVVSGITGRQQVTVNINNLDTGFTVGNPIILAGCPSSSSVLDNIWFTPISVTRQSCTFNLGNITLANGTYSTSNGIGFNNGPVSNINLINGSTLRLRGGRALIGASYIDNLTITGNTIYVDGAYPDTIAALSDCSNCTIANNTIYGFKPPQLTTVISNGISAKITLASSSDGEWHAGDGITIAGLTSSAASLNGFTILGIPITNVTNSGTAITVTTTDTSYLSNSESVGIAGITGFTTNDPNGTFVITVTSSTTFTYTASSAPTGSYGSGGLVSPQTGSGSSSQFSSFLMATSATIANTSVSTTLASGSNGLSLPQATVYVASTTNLTASPAFVMTGDGLQTVYYTGTTNGATPSLTGCTGGHGSMSTGNVVTQAIVTGVLSDGLTTNTTGVGSGAVVS